jgi:hypothetical protein
MEARPSTYHSIEKTRLMVGTNDSPSIEETEKQLNQLDFMVNLGMRGVKRPKNK